jgi:hypothetical protein
MVDLLFEKKNGRVAVLAGMPNIRMIKPAYL